MKNPTNVTVSPKGQVTIPAEIRCAAHIEAGAVLGLKLSGDYIMLGPVTTNGNGAGADRDQSWAWTPEWRERIDRSLAELDAGLGRVYDSDEDFLDSLDE